MDIELEEETFKNIHKRIIENFEQSDGKNKNFTKEEVKDYIIREITNEIYEKWNKTGKSISQRIIQLPREVGKNLIKYYKTRFNKL